VQLLNPGMLGRDASAFPKVSLTDISPFSNYPSDTSVLFIYCWYTSESAHDPLDTTTTVHCPVELWAFFINSSHSIFSLYSRTSGTCSIALCDVSKPISLYRALDTHTHELLMYLAHNHRGVIFQTKPTSQATLSTRLAVSSACLLL